MALRLQVESERRGARVRVLGQPSLHLQRGRRLRAQGRGRRPQLSRPLAGLQQKLPVHRGELLRVPAQLLGRRHGRCRQRPQQGEGPEVGQLHGRDAVGRPRLLAPAQRRHRLDDLRRRSDPGRRGAGRGPGHGRQLRAAQALPAPLRLSPRAVQTLPRTRRDHAEPQPAGCPGAAHACRGAGDERGGVAGAEQGPVDGPRRVAPELGRAGAGGVPVAARRRRPRGAGRGRERGSAPGRRRLPRDPRGRRGRRGARVFGRGGGAGLLRGPGGGGRGCQVRKEEEEGEEEERQEEGEERQEGEGQESVNALTPIHVQKRRIRCKKLRVRLQ
mmetsp:Transcript_46521/g.105133  ORF Transcript_46521/g.105133 Transcript_46521/m.105133 type:complete len:330 (-) Transcript_46521:162-1151(-)